MDLHQALGQPAGAVSGFTPFTYSGPTIFYTVFSPALPVALLDWHRPLSLPVRLYLISAPLVNELCRSGERKNSAAYILMGV